MTNPSLVLGVAAACVLSILPLAASAGTAYSGHRPAHWQRSHDGQGVMRVYGGDGYRTPEPYIGGEFRGGLDVQTSHDRADYQDEYYETSDRYAAPPRPAAGCRAVCVTADAPPPPCFKTHREIRYAAPRVSSRAVVVHAEESHEEHREYYRESSSDRDSRRHQPHRGDCLCRHGDDRYHHADYDDRYDDRRDERYDDRYDDRYGRDVFGRY